MEGQDELTRADLVEFLGAEGGAMVADSQGIEAATEEKQPEQPEQPEEAATEEKQPEEAATEEKQPEEAATEEKQPEQPENNPDLKAMQDKLDAIAEDVTGLKAEPEKDPEPELSTRERLGLPDLDSEEFKENFELYPEQKVLMQSQQDAMIKQQESLDKQQEEINKQNQQIQADQTKQFWSAVEQGHSDYSDYVSPDGELTSKFSTWVKGQPEFLQSAYEKTYKEGSASDVVALVGLIKGPEDVTPTKEDKTALIEKGKVKVTAVEDKEVLPKSLSDIPGSSVVNDPLTGLANSTDVVADLHKAHGGNFKKQEAIIDSMI